MYELVIHVYIRNLFDVEGNVAHKMRDLFLEKCAKFVSV